MTDRYMVAFNLASLALEIAQIGDRNVIWQDLYCVNDVEIDGHITIAGLVDGRDIDADGTKLDLMTLTGSANLDTINTKVAFLTVTQAVDLDAMEARVNALSAALVLKGTWAPSGAVFPTSTVAGETWIASDSGTIDTIPFVTNDRIVALVDGASTSVYAGNWHKLDYTDEVQSVAGRTGAVVLVEADITDLQTYLLETDIDSMAKLNVIVSDTILTAAGIDTLAELNAIVGDATLDDASDPRTPIAHNHIHPTEKSYNFASRNGASGIYYLGGFYIAPVADLNLSNGSPTGTLGTALNPYAAHAFMCFGAGSTDGTDITITVTGTSIDDNGLRTGTDSEVLYDGTVGALTLNDYLETTKKWVGQITYTLTSDGGTFTCDFNYGFAKYEDFRNQDFTLKAVECVGLTNIADAGFELEMIYHSSADWTYHASAFVPGSTPVATMNTDHGAESDLKIDECFAWKRTNFSQAVVGSGSEGVLIRLTTTVNNSVTFMSAHIGVDITRS